MRNRLGRAFFNVLLAPLLLFPVWYLTMWVLAVRVGAGSLEYWLEPASFYFLLLGPQFVAGALLQQSLLLALPTQGWPRVSWRLVAVVSTIAIPFLLVVFGGELRLQATLVPALLMYGVVIVDPNAVEVREPQGRPSLS